MNSVTFKVRPVAFWTAGFLSIAVLYHAVYGPTAALAQASATPKGDFAAPKSHQEQGAWRLDCGETGGFLQTTCRMTQTVLIKETGSPLLTAMVERRPGDRALSLLLKVPHGVLLASGMRLRFDAIEPVVLNYRLSDETGVFASTVLSEQMLNALKTGDTLKVTVVTSSGQAVGIPVTLKGFATAFEKITEVP